VATYQLAITFGILVSYLTGLAIEGDGTWRLMFGLGAVPGLLFLLGLAFLPESPRWLMLKRFPDQARASLLRLRGEGANVSQELQDIEHAAHAEVGKKVDYSVLWSPTVRPALIVGMTLFFLQQLSGINAVIYYAPEIFAHAGFDSGKTQTLATVGIGTVNFLTTILAMYLIDALGRRPYSCWGSSAPPPPCSRSQSRCSIPRWCPRGW
jgi:Sugar (and other) transporter.